MTYSTLLMDSAKTLLPLALAGATALLAKGAQYALHAVKGIKNRQVRDGLDWAIATADTLAKKAVVAANETLVNAEKSAGTFDATAQAKVFQSVLASVTANLGAQAKAILEKELPDLPAFLGTLIESAVATASNKASTVVVAPSAATTPVPTQG